MERVILVLALLAGLRLILAFLQSTTEALKGLFIRRRAATATPEPVQEKSAGWRPYDVPAYQRRARIDTDPARSGGASFEVIA